MKKFLSVLLSALMVISVFTVVSVTASAAENNPVFSINYCGVAGDCAWTMDNNRVLTVYGNGVLGTGEKGEIPSYYEYFDTVVLNEGVTGINDNAFCDMGFITDVTIPDSVTFIGEKSFSGCQKLQLLAIPDSVTSIGKDAFKDCGVLKLCVSKGSYAESYAKKNNIPYTIIALSSTVNDCAYTLYDSGLLVIDGNGKAEKNPDIDSSAVSEIIINNGITGIGEGAFAGFENLKNVSIPTSVECIEKEAFKDCTVLSSTEIPCSVETIGDKAFGNCTGLLKVVMLGYKTKLDGDAFENCPNVELFVNSNSSVKTYAQENNIPFETIYNQGSFPCACKYLYCIGTSFFGNSYYYDPYNNEEKNYSYILDVYGEGSLKPYNEFYDPYITDSTDVVIIEDGITSIDNHMFSGLWHKMAYIADSVKSIGEKAVGYSGDRKIDGFKIYGKSGSEAESYATKNSFSFFATDNSSGTAGDLTWSFSDGTLTVSGEGPMENYSSSSTVPWNDYRALIEKVVVGDEVSSICDYAFAGCGKLTSVQLSDSVTGIGKYAFSGCNRLSQINIPEIPEIKPYTFGGCSSLKSVEIPDSVVRVYEFAFSNCVNLESVIIPDSVVSLGQGAFYRCSNLDGVEIPDSVTTIGHEAFADCFKLANIKLADSVKSIGASAFAYSGLKSIEIPDSVNEIGGSAFVNCQELESVTLSKSLTYLSGSIFQNCTSLTDIHIPSSVKSIGSRAFNNCSSLYAINLPENVHIGDSAFEKCTGLLSDITFEGSFDSCAYIGENAFKNCTGLTYLFIPVKVIIYNDAFAGCTDLEIVYLDNAEKIGEGAFRNCTKLNYVDINEAQTICDDVFRGCTALSAVKIDSFQSIGEDAFRDCAALKTISLNDSAYDSGTIGVNAFCDCISLDDITLPGHLRIIETNTFKGCKNLKEISIPDSVTTINNYAFNDCLGLTKVKLGGSVSQIGSSAFKDCPKLKVINFPASLKKISGNAFLDCPGIKKLVVPSTVTSFGSSSLGYLNSGEKVEGFTIYGAKGSKVESYAADNGFDFVEYTYNGSDESCSWSVNGTVLTVTGKGKLGDFDNDTKKAPWYDAGYAEVNIGNGFTTIGEYAFCDNSSLISIIIPDSVTSISASAFKNCTSLTSLSVPENINEIGASAFENNSSMTKLNLGKNVIKVGDKAFAGCGLKEVIIPENADNIDKNAFADNPDMTIFGLKDTYAETYSNENGIAFETAIVCDGCKSLLAKSDIAIDKAVDPTCTETGLTEGSHCLVCGKIIVAQKEIKKLGHTEVIDKAKAPSCTATGLTEGSHCSVCGEIIKAQEKLPETEHKWDEGKLTKQPTCIQKGEMTYTCEICGKIKTEDVRAKGHSIHYIAGSKPTYTEGGCTESIYCSVCGTYFLDWLYIEPLASTAAYEPTEQPVTFEPTEPDWTEAYEPTEQPTTFEPTEPDWTEAYEPTDQPYTTEFTETYEPTSAETTKPHVTQPIQNATTAPIKYYPNNTNTNSKRINIEKWTVKGIKNKEYTGKAIEQKFEVISKDGDYAEYNVIYYNNIKIGTARVTIFGTGRYTGKIVKTFKITKKKNPVSVKTYSVTIKLKKLRREIHKISAIKVSGAVGKVTYKLKKVPKKLKKLIKINSKGVITFKNWGKAKKGNYKIKVKITAKGNAIYAAKKITRTVKIKVK